MKLQIVSDLHLDSYDHPYKVLDSIYTQADVLVMAGDIKCTGFERHKTCLSYQLTNESTIYFLELLAEKFKDREIIYVPGNHDLWGTSIVEGVKALQEPIAKNLHVLYNNKIVINNQEFIGTTLWFRNNPMAPFHWNYYPDFDRIKNFHTTYDDENEIAIDYLSRNMNKDSIVVTHFMPHELSVHEKYRGDPFNMFFLCDISKLIEDCKPKLFVHGHTHERFDYVLPCGSRVVCNPYGYIHERANKPFKQNIIEI